MLELLLIPVGAAAVVGAGAAVSWYRIVSPSEAHLVVTPHSKFVVSSDDKIATSGRRSYFEIPAFLPFIGRRVRKLDVTIKEIVEVQETYEKNQARYKVMSSTKYRIKDVVTAAETFITTEELTKQLSEVIKASIRAVTVKYDVIDARAKKQEISEAIRKEMVDDFNSWGLELVNFQLVDFQDTEESKIISNISMRREVEVEATTREQNAEKRKQARIKEAESDEKAQEREIERDKIVGEREQEKKQMIAEKEKVAREKEYEVKRVEVVQQAEITKAAAIVKAEENRATEEIMKEQKKLEGEGDRARAEEQAKGDAAPIREKGFAEAEAKEKLQAALNKFGDNAIRALVAELVVLKDKEIGIKTAEALAQADLKVFAGGRNAQQGFNLGEMISAVSTADSQTSNAMVNKIGRPNDLGFEPKDFGIAAAIGAKVEEKKGRNRKRRE